ncbi:Nicotinamide-nucleotide amidohydrolase PncC [Rhodobacteraceae bacterium THAF1]|uniref:CinA family protein n=1 Tax=Palleronia sp. THAF1 TaxID=2587842 RepID=UPI000F3BBFE9|nr:CinA family protein [Palleronia sp. THAF1]QFU08579.1 Nicotinamide-nucleotide amidohydrolase PncC [Palleronia sp. THAF1]VDC30655.1 Nicotinamide-nucleotide amidohydrolase PncC [Rhodobacteraceae bacterium THAF1]
MSLAAQLLDEARRKGVRIATAESCTGGLISAAITDPAGASDVFDYGFVTYSNGAKQKLLGVWSETLEMFGAVSEEVAREMARGARTRARATIAVSVTGIAGPGGSETKPEGRVCFGLSGPRGTRTETVEFGALGRDQVRAATRDHALELLLAEVRALP